jgi:hypothetical protein
MIFRMLKAKHLRAAANIQGNLVSCLKTLAPAKRTSAFDGSSTLSMEVAPGSGKLLRLAGHDLFKLLLGLMKIETRLSN